MRLILVILTLFMDGLLLAQVASKPHYPLIENRGQWPAGVLASADLESGKVFIEKGGLTYHFLDLTPIRKSHDEGLAFQRGDVRYRGHVYQMKLQGAFPVEPAFEDKLPTAYNYFLGSDSRQWAGGCASYRSLLLPDIYPGIDMGIYSQDFFLKYDFYVHPGSEASDISMLYEGMDKIELENGRIKISTSVQTIWEQKPIAWQIIDGEKRYVACEYTLRGNIVSFSFPAGYNRKYELVIDPEIVFSTYSGSSSNNFGYTATYDEEGYLYSGSSAFGQGYPVTTGAYQVIHEGGSSAIEEGIDMALSKYDVSGTLMVWSTFLGGSGDDLPHSIITNSAGELMVYGSTGSADFPTTSGAIDQTFGGGTLAAPSGTGASFPNGSDIVVAHFNADASELLGSTFLGGSANDGMCTSAALKHNYADEFRGEISLDENENILIISSTFSSDFPVENGLQMTPGGGQDAVLLKLTPGLSDIIWSTYIAGSGDDSGFSVTNNSAGEIYICGGTSSTNLFGAQPGAIQSSNAGGLADGYVLKISPDGNNLLSGTYWGNSEYDQLYFIEVDNEDKVYVFGQTTADGSAFIINAAYGTPDSGNLLSKFDAELSEVIWSTVIGTGNGKPNLSPSAFLVDYCNRVYISGWGIITVQNNPLNPSANLHSMNNMETTADAFDNTCTTGDFYMAVFDENMNDIEYGTFFGGGESSEHVDGGTSRFDRKGVIYQSVCAGCGGFDDFPIYPDDAWSPQNNSSCNNGVYKFDFQLPLTIADFDVPPTGCVNTPVQPMNTSTFALTYQWDFGDGSPVISLPSPVHFYEEGGLYTITLVVSHNATCNGSDTLTRTIEIFEPINDTLDDILLCENESAQIGLDETVGHIYSWTPGDFLNSTTIASPTFSDGVTTLYTLQVEHDGCTDVYQQLVDVTTLTLTVPSDTTICDDGTIVLSAAYSPMDASIQWSDEADFSTMLNDNDSDPDIEPEVLLPTTFYVRVEKNGCVLQDEVTINLVSFQTEIEGDFTACAGDTVELSVLDPNEDFIYVWSPQQLVLNGQNTSTVEVVVPVETLFSVSADTPSGCIASDEVLVTVSELSNTPLTATATPQVIVQGQTSQLTVTPGGYTYTWSPDESLNNNSIQSPLATPEVSTDYFVEAADGECIAMAQVRVTVVDFVCGPPSIYVPNAFTPNKDGKNEKLFVRGNNLTDLYFVLYDRWGEKVFETRNLQTGWDGKFEGRDVDPDVYVYYLEATCAGGQQYFEEGNVTVIR
jgi:gliding motility-associated-like protein